MRKLALIFTFFASFHAVAQRTDALNSLVQQFEQYQKQALQEKLFVHVDRPFYLTGETMWFRIYYVDGSGHQPLDVSKVAYLEILDKDQKPVSQVKVALSAGKGDGALFLPASINSGNYIVRAYTNWMKNVGADYFFEKPITIVNPFKKMGLPVLSKAVDYDVQFFPEGGNLVQGIAGNVAFRVTDAAGKGITFRGAVINAQNDTVARFTPQRFGIGRFEFTPVSGTTYRAVIRDESGRVTTRSFPAVHERGYTMRLEEASASQLKITVTTNATDASAVYLLAHTRQLIKAAEMRPIQQEATFLIDKKALGDGVSHLTVFTADRKPVCERLYFKRPAQSLTIGLKPDKTEYATRTSVNIDVAVQASAGKGSAADLSVAVYRLDSLQSLRSADIASYLWMTSDLRGNVESPAYYLQSESVSVNQAIDNLMLTHGWRRFKWDDVLGQAKPMSAVAFVPEFNGPILQATVADPTSGKPVAEAGAFLSMVGRPIRLFTSKSDAGGRLLFEMKDFYGAKNLIIQPAQPENNYRLSIVNPFSEAPAITPLPALDVEPSATGPLENRSVAMQVQNTFWGERSIRYRFPEVDSSAFYGKPTESYLLDAYTRFPAMEEVLREYVPGVAPRKRQGKFKLIVLNLPYREFFEDPSLVLIDGVPVYDMDKLMEFSPLKIKQLDVVTNRYFLGPVMFNGIVSYGTYKGDLAGYPLDPQLLKVDLDGLQLQREFYAPRYDTPRQLETRLPDARTLLYWNPSLTTDAQGNRKFDFFTSDQDGRYIVEVNGLTNTGQAGSQRIEFEVKQIVK